jgi:T-complex protein 1 subunit theta
LIKSGLHPSEVLKGYEKAFEKCVSLLEEATKYNVSDIKSVEEVSKVIKSVIGSKLQYGQEIILSPLIAQACINVLPSDPERFNPDNIRVAKFLGSSLIDSQVVKGLVVGRLVEGTVTSVDKCKVAVFNCPIETTQAETKDTVLFKNADELLNYTRSEEDHLEKVIKDIVDSGVRAVIAGGSVSDMAIHFFDKYNILIFRVMSKFELRRIAKAIGAAPLVRLGAPTREEMGEVDNIRVDEIGSQKCIIITRDSDENKLATVIVRGSTTTFLDNIERVISNGVMAFKSLCKSNGYVAGAGAIEMYLANGIKNYAKTITGLEQYAISKFGEAFEVVPRTLTENGGFNVNEILANLNMKALENPNSGLNLITGEICDSFELGVYDHAETKRWAIKFAIDAILTILKVDQVIFFFKLDHCCQTSWWS